MAALILRRFVGLLAVLFAVSVLVFLIFNVIPNSDPAARMAGRNANADLVASIRHDWGFDRPLWVQYATMMKKTFTGDLVSYTSQLNVDDEIAKGAPRTFALAIGAAIIWMGLGVLIGVISAMRAGRFADRALTVLALVGISMPVFWLGAIALYYLAFKVQIFPNGGYVPFADGPWEWFTHLILPWTVLAVLFIGFYSRVLRSNILDTVNEDYVRTARAKGISEHQVMRRHVLRNSLIPIVTLFGLDFGAVLGGGAILTETVFNLQGVGQYTADAITQLDLPPVMGVTLFGAFFIVVLNAIVDILYAWLDPRTRKAT